MNRVYRRYFILQKPMHTPDPPPEPPEADVHQPDSTGMGVAPFTANARGNIAPPVMERAPTSWILLGLLFAVLISMTLASERRSAIPPGEYAYTEQVVQIKQVLRQKALLKVSQTPETAALFGTAKVPEQTLNELKGKESMDPEAARLVVAATHEDGDEVPASELSLVNKTGAPEDRAFVQIYKAKKLTRADAVRLTSTFPKDKYSFDLARMHAFDKAGDSTVRSAMSPYQKLIALGGVIAFMMLLGFVGIVLWITYFALRASGQLLPLGHPALPMSLPEADRFGYRTVLFIGMFLVVSLAATILQSLSTPERFFLLYGIVLVGVILLHRLPVLGLRIPLSRIGVELRGFGRHLLWAIAAYAAALPVIGISLVIAVALMKIFGQSTHPAAELATSNPGTATVLALYFAAAVVAPFWEEIMFRGTLLPALTRVLGRPLWGILLSSFMFAAIHPQGVPLWLGLGFIGAMNAMLAFQTRSLVPSMLLHAMHNGLLITIALLAS